MTVAKKTETAAKKNKDSNNSQTNGGNIGLLVPGLYPPWASPWSILSGPPLGVPVPALGLPGSFFEPMVPWAIGPWALCLGPRGRKN